MKQGKTRWLLVGVVCLTLWGAGCTTQETRWDSLMADAEKAFQRADYAEAEKLLLAALKEAEKFGEQDPRSATSLNNLALLYYAQGKYTQAEPLYHRALAIREKILGPEHPDVATSLNNLAELSTVPRADTRRPSRSTSGRWRFGRKPWGRTTPG